MRFLLYSDAQLHPWKEFAKINPDGVSDRLHDQFDVLDQILQYAKDNSIYDILFLGDMFESRGRVDVVTAKLLADWKWRVSQAGINQFDVVGNHDLVSKSTTHNAIELYSHIHNQKIITKGYWHQSEHCQFKGLGGILFVPFSYRLDTIKEAINLEPPWPIEKEHSVALIHYGLYDVHTETHGMVHDEGQETEGQLRLSDLEPLLKRVKYVFFGHYHITTAVTSQVHFVGTPAQHKWAEKDVNCRFLDVDLAQGTFKSIETKAPRFYEMDWLPGLKFSDSVKGQFVRVRVPDVKVQEEVKNQLMKHGARGIDVSLVPVKKQYKSALGLDMSMSFEQMGSAMIDGDKTQLNKDRLKQIMVSCLSKAGEKHE